MWRPRFSYENKILISHPSKSQSTAAIIYIILNGDSFFILSCTFAEDAGKLDLEWRLCCGNTFIP